MKRTAEIKRKSDRSENDTPFLIKNQTTFLLSFLPDQISSGFEAQKTVERLSKAIERKQIDESAIFSILNILLKRFKTGGFSATAAFFIHRCVVRCQNNVQFDNAVQYLSQMATILEEVKDEQDLDRLFIQATIKLSRQMRYLKRWETNIEHFFDIAMSACKRMGDERNLALIYCQVACYCHLNNRLEMAIEMFEESFRIIEKLGDEDIKFQAAEYLGLYYLIQGRLGQAAKQFEKTLSAGYDHHDPIQAINAVYLATCTVNVGQFVRALGITHSYWQFSKLSNHKYISFIQAFLGTILLTMGKKEEAFQHLSEAKRDAEKKNDVWSIFWSKRSLAYYHFLNEHIEDSHSMMESCMQLARDNNLKSPIYFTPWLLDLLHAYHLHGLRPIPGLDFDDEMDRLIHGPNIHLRGTAYRLLGKQGEINGDDPKVIEILLKNSISDLSEAGDIVQLGKTKSDLALLKLRLGNKTEAKNLSLQAYETLSILGIEGFPEQLKALIKVSKTPPPPSRPTTHDILNRCMAIADELFFSDDTEEFMYALISSIVRIFDAERGAYFIFTNAESEQQPVYKVLYNLTTDELKNKNFKTCLKTVTTAYRKNEPECRQLLLQEAKKSSRRFQSIFCIPVKIRNYTSGILYLDRVYSQESFELFREPEYREITVLMGRLFGKMTEFLLKSEKKSQIALEQTVFGENTSNTQIIGKSRIMIDLLSMIDRLSRATAPVLITGETGVGKELLASRLHEMGPRKSMPFIPVNISAIPETLIESQLFGHEKGAYTGAERQKKGLMELANKGTLFIDEVGDIPMSVQVKLLRAIEEKAFYRVGGSKRIKSNFRIVAATNRDLEKDVAQGRYREDLYYRLSVVPVSVPSLRERRDDIVLIAEYFLDKYSYEYKCKRMKLDVEAVAQLKAHHWPGNIRELKNAIERAVIVSSDGNLELTIPGALNSSKKNKEDLSAMFEDKPSMEEMQRRYLQFILKETNGKLTGTGGATEILQMKNSTLYDRLKKLGIKK